jgi:hypothetical protein
MKLEIVPYPPLLVTLLFRRDISETPSKVMGEHDKNWDSPFLVLKS